MIIGIGTDLVEIARVEKALKQKSFLMCAFTERERRQSGESSSFLAGCFAVKEAVAKCLGTGFSGFSPREIEVLRDGRGKPYATLLHGAKERCRAIGGTAISVSISNTRTLALAFAVLEREDPPPDPGETGDGACAPGNRAEGKQAGSSGEEADRDDGSNEAGGSQQGRWEQRSGRKP